MSTATADQLNEYFLDSYNRSGLIQYWANRHGDYKLACSFTINGEKKFSKHWTVIECQEHELFGFISTASHRQIFANELILDFDLNFGESLPELRARFDACIKELLFKGVQFKAYETGSRGYHIHMLCDVYWVSPRRWDMMKKSFIRKFACDTLKASSNVLIALEFAPHWKTGRQKRLLLDTTQEDLFHELSR